MAKIVLLIRESRTRQLVEAALQTGKPNAAVFDVAHAHSFAEAAPLACRQLSALLLFDYPELNAGLLNEVRWLRTMAPACIVCAVSATRRFWHVEATALRRAGVHSFLEESTLKDEKLLIAALEELAAKFAASRVLAFLQPKLTPAMLEIARILVASACDGVGRDIQSAAAARMRRLRRKLKANPPVSAERLDVTVRLLLLIDLVETLQRPISALFSLVGFPSANDARQLLHRYSMVGAEALGSSDARERARSRLVKVLLGDALPERRSAPGKPRSGRSAEARESRRAGEPENRRTGEPENQTPEPPDWLQNT